MVEVFVEIVQMVIGILDGLVRVEDIVIIDALTLLFGDMVDQERHELHQAQCKRA